MWIGVGICVCVCVCVCIEYEHYFKYIILTLFHFWRFIFKQICFFQFLIEFRCEEMSISYLLAIITQEQEQEKV